jgi:hypothetical protein
MWESPRGLWYAGGRFVAGLISGGQTVAVALQEALDASRVTTGTIVATKAGTWGLGVYVQTGDNRCSTALHCIALHGPTRALAQRLAAYHVGLAPDDAIADA